MKKNNKKLYIWCYINDEIIAPRGFAKPYKDCMNSHEKNRPDVFKLFELKEVKNAKP